MPPKTPPKAEDVVEDESSVVDETTESEETTISAEDEAETESSEETTDTAEPTEEVVEEAAEEEPAAEEPAPASAEVAEQLQRIKDLEAENAQLKGEKAEPAATKPEIPNITAFVNRTAPEAKRKFLEAPIVTVGEDGTPKINKEAMASQFDSLYQMTDHMIGAVIADHVSPVLDRLAVRNITLANELEIRDLRTTSGSVFKSLEPTIRKELKALGWKDRVAEDAVTKIYHRLLGARNGHSKPAAPAPTKRPAAATAALKDISAGGGGGAPRKQVVGVKLTPEQEADFAQMVEEGLAMTRERYAARVKARQDKAKSEKRPIPKTLRSFR